MKNYSKKFAVFLSLVLILSMLMPALSCISGTGETAEAATMKLNKTSATIYLDNTLQLKVQNLPKKAKVSWSSDNKSIAKVSSTGLVTGITANCAATITAKVKYTPKGKRKATTKKLTCIVLIVYPPLERTLNVDEQHIGTGDTFELSVMDADIFDKITFSVKDPYIASVDVNGVVYGRSLGSTEVYADVTSADRTQNCRLICKLEVISRSQSRSLSYNAKDVEQYRSFQLDVRNASNIDYIEYSSTNDNIVHVSNTGTSYATVTGVNIGTAYIVVKIKKTGNEVETKTCRIVVKEYNKSRTISSSASSITKGKTAQISIGGLDPILDTVAYETSDKKVATVDAKTGLVTGVGAGGPVQITAKITFPTGETTSLYYSITVTEPPKETTDDKRLPNNRTYK